MVSTSGEEGLLLNFVRLPSMLGTADLFTHLAHLLGESYRDGYHTDPASRKLTFCGKSQMIGVVEGNKLSREVACLEVRN